MTTYTKRTNAKRAAIKAGVAEDQVEITVHKSKDGTRFGWKQRDTKLLADIFPATAKQDAPVKTTVAKPREERNGVKRPNPGGKCAAVWEALDEMVAKGLTPDTAAIKEWAGKHKANENNAVIEFYGWKRFNGFGKEARGQTKAA